jgi:hypothetical protein
VHDGSATPSGALKPLTDDTSDVTVPSTAPTTAIEACHHQHLALGEAVGEVPANGASSNIGRTATGGDAERRRCPDSCSTSQSVRRRIQVPVFETRATGGGAGSCVREEVNVGLMVG